MRYKSNSPRANGFSSWHVSGEDDEAGDVHRVLAQREVVQEGEQETSLQDVILAVTETHFKEKHGITTRTLFRVSPLNFFWLL